MTNQMASDSPLRLIYDLLVILLGVLCLPATMAEAAEPARSIQVELSGQDRNAVKTSWPAIFTWGLLEDTLKPDGYKHFIDEHAQHSNFGLVTLTIRAPVEVTDPVIQQRISEVTAYAGARGIKVAMDLDVRLARQAFMDKYPGEMQEIVRLRDFPMTGATDVHCAIEPFQCGDHYTFIARPYESVSGRVLRVYSYAAGATGIEPESVKDITAKCKIVNASAKGVNIGIPPDAQEKGHTACVMAAFSLFTPDAFGPHLLEFQGDILKQYKDIPLAGACKDEWGFPGRFGPRLDDVWFSEAMAEAYQKSFPKHDLVRDLLLMVRGEKDRQGDRAAAVNHYMELFWKRNGGIETDYYHAIKEVFGHQAVVATHPTWYPMPNREEIFKNGLDWWVVKRDLAQTDEGTPFCVRTALAKKWHSPLWYNMYYNSTKQPYDEDLWRHALGGGRMNFHPIYPTADKTATLLSGNLLRAECRVRLLNYISTAPVDCPVAVVFGHPAAINWTSAGFADVGLDVTNALWQQGHYTDLIPSSEITNGSLTIADDGRIQYGPQRYSAVIFYQPQYERAAVADFFKAAAAKGKTALFRVGDWTADFDAKPFNGNATLPKNIVAGDAGAVVQQVVALLKDRKVEPQTPGTTRSTGGFPASVMPNPSGHCRLLDGTIIIASGEKDVMGDPIQKTLDVSGRAVTFDAIGVAAVRLDSKGNPLAMAGGGLKHFEAGDLRIDLPERADVALWRDAKGEWAGIVQGLEGPVPDGLSKITEKWTRLSLAPPISR